ncbi:hypothetical protein TNCV_1914111 [Trichonephila clavipes]|nr:hypothetical protein TNCV_1914111 [Trichonephila clavipes]
MWAIFGGHGNPAPNNPVWQPYRGIVTLCIELSHTFRIFLDLSISRLFWQVPEVSDRKYFHRLYVNFSNCSTICGGLFWPRIKLFWIPLFGFNHFEPPKTQQLVSEVGLNANNKSDGGPVPDSSRKLTASMNANMGEMKSELTGMNANMGEMKST